MPTETIDSESILEVNYEIDPSLNIAAPPEDLSDEEIFDKSNKILPYKKINENTSAGRLQMRVPDAPDNLIELIYRKKCLECSAILTTISSALSHYNSTKHQNKIALKFLPHGTYNLPLSKEEIREIETGVNKSGEPNAPGTAPTKSSKIPFRELVKKFEINENVHKLDLEFCRLCETPFSSKVAALQHYSGKKHKKNAENWSSFNPIKPIDTKDDLRCDVCNVIGESVAQMETHFAGKKHQIKMKAYLERVNAGAIAPPMSSRGFCDFNNVEREEANPVDPTRFIQENILPKNLSGSFLNQYEPEPEHFEDNYINESNFGMKRNMSSGFDEFGMRGGPVNMGYEHEYGMSMPGNVGFDSEFGMRRPGPIGLDNEFGMPRSNKAAFDTDYMNDVKPPISSLNFRINVQPDIKRSVSNMPEDSNPYIAPPWSNSIGRSQMSAPYAPNIPNRYGPQFATQTFGPTKFKYSRKSQI